MASITCEIKISNQSGVAKNYLLFMDAPSPTNGPTGDVFFNVYDRSPKIQSGNNAFVQWDCSSDFYALYGTSQSKNGNLKVVTGAFKQIRLGPNGSTVGLVVGPDGSPSFDNSIFQPTAAKGGFTFGTNSFTYPNKFNTYIGIGAKAPRGGDDVVPLQTYVAEPLLKSQLFPKLTYFICTGEYEPGVLVDRNTIGKAIRIAFEGAAIPTVDLYQNNKGQYVESETDRILTDVPFTTSNGVTISVSDVENA